MCNDLSDSNGITEKTGIINLRKLDNFFCFTKKRENWVTQLCPDPDEI
jgi:hypothetical protein